MEQKLAALWDLFYAQITLHGSEACLSFIFLIVGWGIIVHTKNWIAINTHVSPQNEKVLSFLFDLFEVLLKSILILIVAIVIGLQAIWLVVIPCVSAVALGTLLKNSVSNFITGLTIIILKKIKEGEYIEVNGQEGTVTRVGAFTCTLITFNKQTIIIPNNAFTKKRTINHTRNRTRTIEIPVAIDHDDTLYETKNAIRSAIKSDPRILTNKPNVIATVKLGERSAYFLVRAFVKTDDYWPLFLELKSILKDVTQNKIRERIGPKSHSYISHTV